VCNAVIVEIEVYPIRTSVAMDKDVVGEGE
jgi:hypothetical protein